LSATDLAPSSETRRPPRIVRQIDSPGLQAALDTGHGLDDTYGLRFRGASNCCGRIRRMIELLLTPIPPGEFLDRHYLKLPFASQGGAADFIEYGTWQTIGAILRDPSADVMLVRQGERWSDSLPVEESRARDLVAEGYTLLVRHAERHDPRLRELAEGFEADFAGPVDVHLYCTPGGQHGFGWHYDAEDVFILQTTGCKEYSLRKNTVYPWPVVETLPTDMRYERELMPLMRCTLRAGDWLYVPAGYWHMGQAEEEAISLAVGVLSTTALDVLDFLRRELPDSLLWRQRLPTPGRASNWTAEQIVEEYVRLFGALGADLARRLQDAEFVRRFLAGKGR
jgi:ribosomal protein L16 Arg81 hydroxylase